MNTVLWVLQAILAVKFATSAASHAAGSSEVMRASRLKLGKAARPLHLTAAAVMLAGALGLALPALLHGLGWLAPAAAGLLAAAMLASIPLHLKSREKALVAADAVLFVLCALAFYGRLALSPL